MFRRIFFYRHHHHHLHQRRRLNRTGPQHQHQHPNPKDAQANPQHLTFSVSGNTLSSTADTIIFCQKHHLLPTSASCPTCRTTLHCIYTIKRLGRQGHEVRFQCNKKRCKSRLNQVSIKKGTWFADSRISLRKTLLLMYCFVQKFNYEHTIRETSVSSAEESDGSSRENTISTSTCTIADYFSYCQEVCTWPVECKLATDGKIDGIGDDRGDRRK